MIRSDLIFPLIRVFLLFGGAVLGLRFLEWRWNILSNFWNEKTHAVNLALARVVIMATLLFRTSLGYLLSYSRLDSALIVPPLGWGHIAAHVPRDPALLTAGYFSFVLCGVLAIAGLYGRVACLLTSLTGIYLLAIPQLFGKVNHDHHLVLFGLILAASPCCDTLSLDAIRNARRLARQGIHTKKPPLSLAYARPLKVMMVLLGLIYFFPGAWKLCRTGLRWFSADNMRWTIAAKLLETGRFTSFQQWMMAHSQVLLAGTFFTVIFELGFLFAILFPKLRPLAALCGLAFHNLTGFLMNIRFVTIQLCYVILIDWHHLLIRLREKLRIEVADVVSSGGHAELLFLNLVSRFDWLDTVCFNSTAFESNAPLVVRIGAKRSSSFDARLELMKRVPLFLPFYLLARLPLSAKFARLRYSRTLEQQGDAQLGTHSSVKNLAFQPQSSPALQPVAIFFIAGMALAGLSHSVNTWPIACYPTFDHAQTGAFNELSVSAIDDRGRVYSQNLSFDPRIGASLSPERYEAMVDYILRDDVPFSSEKAASLVNLWQTTYSYPAFREVILYSNTYTFDSSGHLGRLIRNRELIRLQPKDLLPEQRRLAFRLP